MKMPRKTPMKMLKKNQMIMRRKNPMKMPRKTPMKVPKKNPMIMLRKNPMKMPRKIPMKMLKKNPMIMLRKNPMKMPRKTPIKMPKKNPMIMRMKNPMIMRMKIPMKTPMRMLLTWIVMSTKPQITDKNKTNTTNQTKIKNKTVSEVVILNTMNKTGKPKCKVTVQRKTIKGEKCVFPFRLGLGTPEEKWYCDCTTKGEDRPWCSIQDKEPFEFDFCAGFPGYEDKPKSSDSAGSGSAGELSSKKTNKVTSDGPSANGDVESGPTGGPTSIAETGVGESGAATSASGPALPSETRGKEGDVRRHEKGQRVGKRSRKRN